MPVDPIDAEAFVLQVERFYASLISSVEKYNREQSPCQGTASVVPKMLLEESRALAPAESGLSQDRRVELPILRPGIKAGDLALTTEPSLGGKLLYAGELDAEARALIVAANISGAATLSASSDAEARKQAMRDGVVDFLVTTLDEALRILKNELRKRETVAVCVAQAPEIIEREMQERGVLPDLVRPVEVVPQGTDQVVLTCRVLSSPALWLPKIDAIANESLGKNSGAPALAIETWESTRRWLRLSPRYLGRLAQGVRVLRCSQCTAQALMQRWKEAVDRGEIGAAVEIKLMQKERTEQNGYAPTIN